MSTIRCSCFALSALAFVFASPAHAVDYTDIWWASCVAGDTCDKTGHENGWGVNFVQNEDIVFATFYIYDAEGHPLWVSAPMSSTPMGNYTGDLNYSIGSFFGGPWYGTLTLKVGTATFTPTSAATGTLSYSFSGITGIPNSLVTKNIDRASFRTIVLRGGYVGGQSGGYRACLASASNMNYVRTFNVTVTQDTGSGAAAFLFQYTNGVNCELSGTLEQQGQLYAIPSAGYACSDGLNTTASMSEIRTTSLGIEGRFAAANIGGGCREDASFAAVRE